MKVLIVVGSAPCLHEDLNIAREKYPGADVMTINEACGAVEDIQHMLAGHTVKAEAFVSYRKEKFPEWPLPVEVHANWHSKEEAPFKDYPSVTKWWGGAVSSGATSAGKAIRIGLQLGYTPIVLAGCPLDGSGYFNPHETEQFQKEFTKFGKCKRVGDPNEQKYRGIVRYRETFAKLAKTEWKGKVFSMSGFSKQCLDGL